MATPTVVSAASTTAASATSLTISAPASIARGNLLLAVVATTNTSTALVPPADWTLLNAPATGESSYWKIATSVEPANYTWTWTTASVSCGLIVQLAGNNPQPIDASGGQANASSANIVAPTLTPKGLTDLLLNIYVTNGANAITVPAGQSDIGGTTGNTRAIICGYQGLVDTFATGTITSSGVQVTTANTVTIGGKVYTFRTALTPAEGEILIGVDADASLTNLANAINCVGAGGPGTNYVSAAPSAWVTCSAVVAHVLTLTSLVAGTSGNATTLAKVAATLTLSGATLAGAVASNSATGTRTATATAAVNYGFGFVVRDPINIAELLLPRPVYVNSAALVGRTAATLMPFVGMYYGRYKVVGNTLEVGTLLPLPRQVLLYNANMVPVRGAITPAQDGSYLFDNVAPGLYTVLGIGQGGENSQVLALVNAVPM